MTTSTKTKRVPKNIEAIITRLRGMVNLPSERAHIGPVDLGKLLKFQLKLKFPKTKFSVRKSDGSAIDIYWTDGPPASAVRKISDGYSFGGFDGMIDMAYYSDCWLLSDGSLTFAGTGGTAGSLGSVKAQEVPQPTPDAIRLTGYTKYVFTHRSTTPEHDRKWADAVAKDFGYTIIEGVELYNQWLGEKFVGRTVGEHARTYEEKYYEKGLTLS